MSNDLANSIFELFGALFAWMNAYTLYKDKQIKGVYWPIWLFYTSWGMWNLYYYPALNQWLSFYAGAALTSGNLVWVVMAVCLYFKNKSKGKHV